MYFVRALCLSALVAVLCACPGDPDPRPDGGTDAGVPDASTPDAGPPDEGEPDAGMFLSEVPRWQVGFDASYTAGCFGRSIALGDVNGDGLKDLVVAAPPCLPTTRDPGRVSIFAGAARYFSKQAHTTVMDWRNTSTRTNGNNMLVATGKVNWDAHADVLVSGIYGALVFKGQPDLGALFAQPLFQVPGSGTYGATLLTDVTGDGLDDLVSSKAGVVSVYRAQTALEGEPFTLVPRTTPLHAPTLRAAGDVNGDGAQDVLAGTSGNYRLYLGCKEGTGLVCDGALTAQPVWTDTSPIPGLVSDLSGDGLPDRFTGPGGGTLSLHFSDAQAEGGFSATPVWTVASDPLFSLLGSPIAAVGDLDGDGQRRDFVLGSLGRLYYFSPGQAVSSELEPAWAWPRADSLPDGYEGFQRFAVVAPGDLNHDGFDDLVAGMAPPAGLVSGPAGRVVVLGGGHVPPEPAARPYLPEEKACGLQLDPASGKPDLTVDEDVLARSLYVERRTFAEDACEVVEGCIQAGGERKLLRFSTSIVNLGSAAASVPNSQERPDLYVFDACHGHEHLTGFAGYALRDAQGNEVVKGRKQGFYLVDYHRQCSDAAPYFVWSERMGISAGWSDIYVADIPCQWLDITGVPDGTYTLRVGVDEKDIIDEADAQPNEKKLEVRITGDSVSVLP